jgi:phage repressor protein C with HTH and peptisase S24 domain
MDCNALNVPSFSVLNMTLGERIKSAREEAGLSKSDLARSVGVSASAVTQWENGETRTLEGENLVRAAVALLVDPVWLATGKGDRQPRPIVLSAGESKGGYRSLTPYGEVVVVPVFDARASMGPGVPINEHDTVIGGMQLSERWVSRHLPNISSRGNLAVISAIGDSMSPTFSDGDILLVDRGVFELKLDAVYVLAKGDELFVKRVHRKLGGGVTIKSDNPLHGQEDVDDPDRVGLRILGRVVWAWNGRRL